MAPDFTKCNVNVTNSSLRLVLHPGGSVTALFSLRSVPSTAAPPTTPARAPTLSRVRLAVSGLGGCYASVRSRLMRGNEIHPHPPPTNNCTTQRGRRSDWPPARQSLVIKWKRNFICVSETTSSFARTIVRPLPLFTIEINGDLPTRLSVHVFVQLDSTRTLLMTTYDGDIRNNCRLQKRLMKRVDRFFVGLASISPVVTYI